ncbi:MAG: hypothetical protein KGZ96_10580 [Clostridia bacterium]|nr:hypothetical protein [Clostridia bacterium]
MYSDIEELMKEIEKFKSNINESGQLCNILINMYEQLKSTNESFNSRYEQFFAEIAKVNENLNNQSEDMIQKHLQIVEKQKADIEEKYSEFVSNFSKALDVNKAQQDAFEKKAEVIIERLNNLEIEALLKEIKKVNLKVSLLFGGVGIAIIIAVISLF